MERIRVHTYKELGKKLAKTSAGLLALSFVACNPGPDTSRPAACVGDFGEVRKTVGTLTATGLPEGQINDLQEFDRTAEVLNVRGFYGEPQKTLYSGAPEYMSYWQVLKDGKEKPLKEGQANLCVESSHLARLAIASPKITSMERLNGDSQLVAQISINNGESKIVPLMLIPENDYRRDINGGVQGVFVVFELYGQKLPSGGISPESRPDEIKNLTLRFQMVDKDTSEPVAGTQRVINVSFAEKPHS